MTSVINLLANIFGVSTFVMIFLGLVTIITGGSFGIQEITFLMFVFFLLTVLVTMSRDKDKKAKD
jgi:membrane protein implicated in regulation of membrane protease activity